MTAKTSLSAHIAGFAMIAMAAVPVAAVSTLAHAAPAPSVRVSDLDLNSADGRLKAAERIDRAARLFCRDAQETGTRLASARCISEVKAELGQKLNGAQRPAQS